MTRDRGQAPFISGPERKTAPETGEIANYFFYTVILLLLTLAGWLYLSTTVRVDALAVEIYRLELGKEELRREIVQRGAKLAELESLQRVRREAERLGFRPRTRDQQLLVPRRAVPAPSQAGPGPAPEPMGLWQRLSRFLRGGDGADLP
ncbi:MAG: LPXTG cell wall anchor domain-containing protein [Chloroflexi bacterium]|jgi:LPXTG-motif cell wall-anchored protein|nr:LPXTG cell wall anchor domain-containing protein [Chloroflexota bacterium]